MFKVLIICAITYLAVARPSDEVLDDKDELLEGLKSLKGPIEESIRFETDKGNVYDLEIGANMTYFHLTAKLTEATTPDPLHKD